MMKMMMVMIMMMMMSERGGPDGQDRFLPFFHLHFHSEEVVERKCFNCI